MKKMMFAILFTFLAAGPASAQSITGNVVESGSGQPLASENWPYVQISLLKAGEGGQLVQVAGTDCWNSISACATAGGFFSISNEWDGKPLAGAYLLEVSSQFHIMEVRRVYVSPNGTNLGDINLQPMPAGVYFTAVQSNPDGSVTLKLRAYRRQMNEIISPTPSPALAVRLVYYGPGVTTPFLMFQVGRKNVEWESGLLSKEITFTLPVDKKLPNGSLFSGTVTLERAGNSFYQYSQQSVTRIKAIPPDFTGW
jgi:hypothetical protein